MTVSFGLFYQYFQIIGSAFFDCLVSPLVYQA